MSTDTTKGSESPEEVEGAQGAVEDSKPRAAAAKPQKKPVRRRVRVIEVLDEGDDEDDIQDILDNLDAIDEASAPPELKAAPAPEPAEVPAPKPEAVPATEPAAVHKPEPAQPHEDAEAAQPAKPAPKPSASADQPPAPRRRELSEGVVRAALIAVVVLVAGSLTAVVFFWSKYDDLDSAKAARKAVAARATAYGNQMATYSTADIKGSQDRIKAFLTGDALKGFQGAGGAPANTSGKQISTTSKVDQVLVSDVNGKLATAVVIWHLDMASSGGQSTTVGSNLAILLDMAKVNGNWMVAHQQPLTSDLSGSGGNPGATPTPSK